ncbi:RagB/SusD family nutrient uptake outer membrane protein [Bacteroides salyersiae]|nr:RagB/SusD family nutrient uptake outer membrane protein [Bacteroides salyersiae]
MSGSAGGSANYQWTSGENRWSDWWLTTYQAIGACNTAISRIKESTFDENKRILLLSEARCLRAFYYYHALTYWGGVPLLQDEITSLDQVKNVKRATKDELAKFIIDELEEVSPLLEKNPAVVARISKGASYTLLAKMYLLQKQWEKAAGACEEVMGLNKYKLFDNYSDIFSRAFENEQGTHFLHTIQCRLYRLLSPHVVVFGPEQRGMGQIQRTGRQLRPNILL